MGPGDPGRADQARKLADGRRGGADRRSRIKEPYLTTAYGVSPASPLGLRRARFASVFRMAAPREAAGEAWWTAPSEPTITRRLAGPFGPFAARPGSSVGRACD